MGGQAAAGQQKAEGQSWLVALSPGSEPAAVSPKMPVLRHTPQGAARIPAAARVRTLPVLRDGRGPRSYSWRKDACHAQRPAGEWRPS